VDRPQEGLMGPGNLIADRAAVQAPSALKAGQGAYPPIHKVLINEQSATSWATHHPAVLKDRAEGLAEESVSPACFVEATRPNPCAASRSLLLQWRKRMTARRASPSRRPT